MTIMTSILRARPIRGLTTRALSSADTQDLSALIESLTANPDTHDTFDVYNPASQDIIAKVPVMNQLDAQQAIARAADALPSWRDDTTAAARGAILTQWSRNMQAQAENIAAIMTMESGKPLAESRGEVNYATSFLDYFAAEAVRPSSAGGGFLVPTPFVQPGASDNSRPRGQIMAMQQAVGTCAMITPWNFPAAMVCRKPRVCV